MAKKSRLKSVLTLRCYAHQSESAPALRSNEVFGSHRLKPGTRRRLARAAEDLAAGKAPSVPKSAIKPGTRLLREWQGVMHEVIVLEDGVQYRGRTWRSLSAVAREITGTRWSGPLFFGLRKGGPRPEDSADGD